jgi:ABC-2 type transport system permease protein
MHRILALVERELRRLRRSPLLIVVTIFSPLIQLVVLGYAFGGTLHNLRVGLVDQDHGLQALKLRELTSAVAANANTFSTIPYAGEEPALRDLRDGKLSGVLIVPPGFSRRVLTHAAPRVAFVENNTDRFVSAALDGSLTGVLAAYGAARLDTHRLADDRRLAGEARLEVVELFPYVPYIQYLLPGSIVLAIFTMVMIGGAFAFIDDKSSGRHEGYLVTPITRLEMVAGFNISGAIKAVTAGLALMVVGSLLAGIPHPLEPLRLLKMTLVICLTALALVSMMFMFMVRVNDIMVPRIAVGILNTLLFFPSGAVYPTQAFPAWMRAIAALDPFTYAVHALRSLLIQDAGLGALTVDLAALGACSVVSMAVTALLLKRTL